MTEDKLRDAAILIRSLDYATARRVLQSVRPETAAQLTQLAAEMGRVASSEVRHAIASFRVSSSACSGEALGVNGSEATFSQIKMRAADQGDIEDPQVRVSKTDDGPTGIEPGDPCPAASGFDEQSPVSGIASLESPHFSPEPQFEADLLVETLERERPQVIAAVLAKKSPGEAAEVLQGLCEDLRAVVLQRIAKIAAVDDEVHRMIAVEIEQGVEQQRRRRQRRDAGQAAVDAILAAQSSHAGSEEACLPLVESRPTRVTFAEFQQLDDASLLTVLNHAEPQVIQVAMLDLPLAIATRIKRLSPHADAGQVTKTPLLLGDIEHAQEKLAALASQLAESGVIVLATSNRLSAAA